MLMNLCGFIFLLCESIQDCKSQELDVTLLAGFGVLGFLARVLYMKSSMDEVLESILIGVVFIVFSSLTKEAIGYGDGVVLLILGLFCGIRVVLQSSLVAFFLVVGVCLFIGIKRGADYEMRVPFVPYLLFGFIGGMIW